MGRRTLLLITSILIAAVGTALIGLYVKGADSRATDKQSLVNVLVATTVINPGERATQNNSRFEQWVKADLPLTPIYSAASIANQSAATTIYPRTVLQPAMFSAKASSTGSNGVPKNLLGVNIELGDPDRAAGLLKVGSRVVIFWRPKGKPSRVALGQNGGIQIIELGNNYLGQTINGTSNLSTRTPTVTPTQTVASTLIGVALTQDDVMKLKDDSVNGDLYFAVVGTGPLGNP